MGTLKLQSNGPLYSNTVIGTLAVDDRWAVTFGTARRELAGAPNVTAHLSSTASVPTSFIRCGNIIIAFEF